MRVLIDTNILVDLLLGREPYYDIAYDILTMCADKKIYGYLAAHSVPDLFYILRKFLTKEERREVIKDFVSSRISAIAPNDFLEICR